MQHTASTIKGRRSEIKLKLLSQSRQIRGGRGTSAPSPPDDFGKIEAKHIKYIFITACPPSFSDLPTCLNLVLNNIVRIESFDSKS